MIWRATLDDVDRVLPIAIRFNDNYTDYPIIPEKARSVIELFITEHVAFCSETGFIGGIVQPDPMRDATFLIEMAWYSEDRTGIALLKRFTEEGVALGVDEVRMCTMDTSSRIADKILLRAGYSVTETSYKLKL